MLLNVRDELDNLRHQPPTWLTWAVVIFSVAALIPLAFIVKSRWSASNLTRIHLIQDMDAQPKVKAQQASLFFADGRGNRKPVEGSVPQMPPASAVNPHDNDALQESDGYYRGTKTGADGKPAWLETLPPDVPVTAKLLDRGQERFRIYCTPCHGWTGEGNGPVHLRAVQLREQWTAPANLHTDTVRARSTGFLFNVITNGFNNMPRYGDQIPVADRWAIVAYVRALQRSQHASASDIDKLRAAGKVSDEEARRMQALLTQGPGN